MRKIITFFIPVAILMAGCGTLDCPLNNSVYATYKLAGDVKQLTNCRLTISTTLASGTDSILLNQQENADSFSLPVSYAAAQDRLYFEVTDGDNRTYRDTVEVEKESRAHFESIDCSASYFHTLKGVKTTHHLIDSIVINHKDVTYDATQTHFLVYFGTRD